MEHSNKYFSDSTGIPNHSEPMKKKEIIYIEINPQDYLSLCENGFQIIQPELQPFKPETDKMERITELAKKAIQDEKYKGMDIPFIEENYTSWSNDDEELTYYFSQEGRHRATIAIQLGLDTIPMAYIRGIGTVSRIGMEQHLDKYDVNQEKEFVSNLHKNKKQVQIYLKKILNKTIDFQIDTKKYNSDILGAYTPYSLSDDLEPKIFINYFLDRIMENHQTIDITEDAIEDTILHEYGHLIFELLEDTEGSDRIKTFYNEKYITIASMQTDFINFILSHDEEYMNNFEDIYNILNDIDNEEADYFYEQYFDNFIEEEFAENFSKFVRLKLNNKKYFRNVKSEEDLRLITEEIKFFENLIPIIQEETIEFNSELEDNNGIEKINTIIK